MTGTGAMTKRQGKLSVPLALHDPQREFADVILICFTIMSLFLLYQATRSESTSFALSLYQSIKTDFAFIKAF